MSEVLARIQAAEAEVEQLYAESPRGVHGEESPAVQAIVAFVQTVVDAGREADVTLLTESNIRDDLQRTIDLWCERLEGLMGRPVVHPPLEEFHRPILVRVDTSVLADRLGPENLLTSGPSRQLSGLHFKGGSLQSSDFRAFGLIDCRFEELDLSGSTFGPETVLTRTWFEDCRLDRIVSQVTSADDYITPIEGSLRASSCVFNRCTFAGAHLVGSTFSYCVFDDLEVGRKRGEADVSYAVFTASTFVSTRFEANLDGAVFTDCVLEGASFEGVNLGAAVFSECDLVGVDFSGAVLTRATFSNCNMRDVSFSPVRTSGRGAAKVTDLRMADLSRCRNLEAVQFSTAELDEWTRLPPALVEAVKDLRETWRPRQLAELAE